MHKGSNETVDSSMVICLYYSLINMYPPLPVSSKGSTFQPVIIRIKDGYLCLPTIPAKQTLNIRHNYVESYS